MIDIYLNNETSDVSIYKKREKHEKQIRPFRLIFFDFFLFLLIIPLLSYMY